VEKCFAAMVTRLDSNVGAVVNKVHELGLDSNTIIFFCSDNGPHSEGGHVSTYFNSNGPLRGMKRDLWDGGIRVPMIVRWTGKTTAGRTSNFAWAFWDFLPTAA
jgi:arylsulfatase A-like enzyme